MVRLDDRDVACAYLAIEHVAQPLCGKVGLD